MALDSIQKTLLEQVADLHTQIKKTIKYACVAQLVVQLIC